MASPIRFDRKPYIISYVDTDGQQKKIRRVPPPKLHSAMPTDRVELKTRKSDHFRDGEVVTVKHISPRQPNVLQVENEDGQTTFISHYEMVLKDKITESTGIQSNSGSQTEESAPVSSGYLDWP